MRCHNCERAGTECGLTGGMGLDPKTRALHETLFGAAMELASRTSPDGQTSLDVDRFILGVLSRTVGSSDSSVAELEGLLAEGERLEALTSGGPEPLYGDEVGGGSDPEDVLDTLRAHIDCKMRVAATRALEAADSGREDPEVFGLVREILTLLRNRPARREELAHILLLCEDLDMLVAE